MNIFEFNKWKLMIFIVNIKNVKNMLLFTVTFFKSYDSRGKINLILNYEMWNIIKCRQIHTYYVDMMVCVFGYIYSPYLFIHDVNNYTFTMPETEIRINNGWGNENNVSGGKRKSRKIERGKKMLE